MTKEDLKRIVQDYYERLQFNRPLVKSEKFAINSYSKWACKEILRFIDQTDELPFNLTPIEILEYFSEKMKQFACMNERNSKGFIIAADTAEYLVEESWRFINRKEKHT